MELIPSRGKSSSNRQASMRKSFATDSSRTVLTTKGTSARKAVRDKRARTGRRRYLATNLFYMRIPIPSQSAAIEPDPILDTGAPSGNSPLKARLASCTACDSSEPSDAKPVGGQQKRYHAGHRSLPGSGKAIEHLFRCGPCPEVIEGRMKLGLFAAGLGAGLVWVRDGLGGRNESMVLAGGEEVGDISDNTANRDMRSCLAQLDIGRGFRVGMWPLRFHGVSS